MKQILYEKYINNEEALKELKNTILLDGLHLIEAPTGAGKTTSIKECFKELSKLHKDRVFIIACPNKVQNEQNADTEVIAIVGGTPIDKVIKISSMVYDKSSDLLKAFNLYEDYKITLIIDEAHQLVFSKGFRKEAINNLLNVCSKCDTVIHLTATANILKACYNYDSMLQFRPVEGNNNIGNFDIVKANDVTTTLITTIKRHIEAGNKILLFYNNHDKTSHFENVLKHTFKSKKVGKISSKDKENNDIYKSIIKSGMIPKEYDIVFATSVLECGTNILNENYIPIVFIDNNIYYNSTSVIQQVARLRNKVDKGYLIFKEPSREEKTTFKELEQLAKEQLQEFEGIANSINTSICLPYLEGNKNLVAKALINSEVVGGGTLGKGILFVDEVECIVKIDLEALYSYVASKYDLQLLTDMEKLTREFKGYIKADSINIITDGQTESKEATEVKEKTKEAKEKTKEQREQLKEAILEGLKENVNRELITDYLTAHKDDKKIFVAGFTDDLRENILKAEKEHPKILDEFKKSIKTYNEIIDIEKMIELGFDSKLFKSEIYLYLNRCNGDVKKIKQPVYSKIRKCLDNMIQKSISEKYLEALYKEVYSIKKSFTQSGREKLIQEIELIYNVTYHKDSRMKISSIKK